MADTPFFSGKDAVIRFFLNGNEVVLRAKTWEFGVNKVAVADGVNGENRDRLQSITNYFEGTITCFQSDTKALANLLTDIANDDSEVAPLNKTLGIQIRPLDGSKSSFVGKEAVVDAWRLNQGGRTERTMLSIPIRCRYFDPVASV